MSENKSKPATAPGAQSLDEILSQPHCWSSCLKELPQILSAQKIRKTFGSAREWLFVGCGSSYYIALAAAASWSAITGLRARAIPASDLLLFPDLTLAGSTDVAAVIISRSGRTSEAVRAAELLKEKNIPTLGVTCTADQPLQRITTKTLALLPAHEESTVMTRSFSSMLLSLQYTAAWMAENHGFTKSLLELPACAETVLTALHPRIKHFADSRQFAGYISLGQGPFYGLACECALKLAEMSISLVQCYHMLEFRHGPKSVVSPEMLTMFLISESGHDAECNLLEETKAQGATTLTMVNRADERVRASSDLLIEFGFELPELARLTPYLFAGQLLGLYTGLRKGFDPDNPRNLSRVVVLDEESSREKTRRQPLQSV